MERQVEKIAELMQYKLDKNKHKECAIMNPDGKGRGWDKCDVRWLLKRLREEGDEIEKALNDNEEPIEIAKECADVCNFAMIIADNVGGLDTPHFYERVYDGNAYHPKSAEISKCGKYRYSLTRIWDESKPKVMFIMLNPSTADETQDDPTIRRCIGFAKSWGFGGLYVCNIFSYRATNPKELLTVNNPFGDENIWHTKQLADKVDIIVCAWGNEPILKKILKNMNPYKLLEFAWLKLHYLGLSKNEVPKHPLYLKSDLYPTQVAYIIP